MANSGKPSDHFGKEYSLRVFFERYRMDLPVIVEIMDGYLGINELEISSGDVYAVRAVEKQERILLKDDGGRHISIPLNHRKRFNIVTKNEPNGDAVSLRYVEQHWEQKTSEEEVFIMVENNNKLEVCYGVDYEKDERLGRLRVVDTYDEKYLVVHALQINDDHVDGIPFSCSTSMLIPLYMDLRVRVLMLFKEEIDLESWLKKFAPRDCFGDDMEMYKKITLLPKELDDDGYEYIKPCWFVNYPRPSLLPTCGRMTPSNNMASVRSISDVPPPLPPRPNVKDSHAFKHLVQTPKPKHSTENVQLPYSEEMGSPPPLPPRSPVRASPAMTHLVNKTAEKPPESQQINTHGPAKLLQCPAHERKGTKKEEIKLQPQKAEKYRKWAKTNDTPPETRPIPKERCYTNIKLADTDCHILSLETNHVPVEEQKEKEMYSESKIKLQSVIQEIQACNFKKEVNDGTKVSHVSQVASIKPTPRPAKKPVVCQKPARPWGHPQVSAGGHDHQISKNSDNPPTCKVMGAVQTTKCQQHLEPPMDEVESVKTKPRTHILVTEVGDVSSLSVQNVITCLGQLGMSEHVETLQSHQVDGALLTQLSREAFKEMGFSLFETEQIIAFIHGWRPKFH